MSKQTLLEVEQNKVDVLDELMEGEEWQDETAQIILGALKEEAEANIKKLTQL